MTKAIPEVSLQTMARGDVANPRAGALLGFTPESWIRLYREVGPVFRFAESGATFLCGPEANAAAWKSPDDWSYAQSTTGNLFITQLGVDYITASDGDTHRRQRKLLRPTISREALARHVPRIAAELHRTFEALAAGGVPFDLHSVLITTFTRVLNLTTVVSNASPGMIESIAQFEEELILGGALDDAARAQWYARASYLALRTTVLQHFRRVVTRRLAGERAGDSLDLLIRAMPGPLTSVSTVDELTRHAYLLQAGGAGNIATMACNLLAELTLQPNWLPMLEAESSVDVQVFASRGVQDTPMLAAVLLEAERRFAPTPAMPKVATADLDFLGVAIPCGCEVVHAFGVVNYLPEQFPDPLRFDPSRWFDRKSRKPAAFGGGEHMCLGIDVARVFLLLLLVTLLRSFRLVTDALPYYRRSDETNPNAPRRLAWQVRIRPRASV